MSRRLVASILAGVICAGVVFLLFKHYGSQFAEAEEANVPIDPSLVSANTKFGFRLFSELLKQEPNRNIFISPASLSLSLSMTYNGAAGGTKQAMADALQLGGMTREQVNNTNAALLANLEAPGPGVKLAIANSLWARPDINFHPDFMRRNQTSYRAEVTNLDFSSPSAKGRINSWVEDHTDGRIKKIVDDTDGSPVLFLVNAVYFKGTWTDKFKKQYTKDGEFTLADGSKKAISMMSRTGGYRYYETNDFQGVSLPYGKGRVSLYILLPKKGVAPQAFFKSLNAMKWEAWMGRFSREEVPLTLPRFKVDYTARRTLRSSLAAMGMGVAFDQMKADFNDMCSATENVYISDVTHRTFLDVDEEGTEAAAATSTEATPAGIAMPGFEMVVDHPFFCAIRDNKTGEILFMGAITDPQ